MNDRFSRVQDVVEGQSLDSPASRHYAVVPSDTADLPWRPRALYVTADGNLSMMMDGATEPLLYPVTAGSILPIRPRRIMATGTTATAIAWD